MDDPPSSHGAPNAPVAPNAPASPDAPDTAHRLSRRQLITALGALGIAGTGAAILGLERFLGPSSAPPEAPPLLGASPLAATSATPVPSAGSAASGSATPSGPRHAFRSRPDLTPPVVTVTAGSAGDESTGLIFLTPGNGAGRDGPLIIDAAGEPVWVGPDSKATVVGLTVLQLNGADVLCWWEGENNNGIGTGEYVFVDANYREMRRLTGARGAKVDLHELLLTPNGTALVFVAEPIKKNRLTGQSLPWPVMDCIVQEVDLATGALRFEWHAADHIAPEESLTPQPTKADAVYDYIHGNAIEVDSDGNLLVSARNTSAIYKVDRRTGNVIWRMGGKRSDFEVSPDAAFGWQHDVRRRPDGTITLFDNAHGSADDTTGHPSRAIVIRPDEARKVVALVREYRHPTPLIASSQGNVQLLPSGELFVGWGSTPWFTQFAAGGETVFDANFPAAKQSYRTLRFAWSGRPVEPPAIAVERRSADSLSVYASWNGHTGVASWQVLGGPSAASLEVVASAERAGFETAIEAATTAALIAVRALDAAGAVLGSSTPVAAPA
jgi:arylsulfotransferase ASST